MLYRVPNSATPMTLSDKRHWYMVRLMEQKLYRQHLHEDQITFIEPEMIKSFIEKLNLDLKIRDKA